MRKVIRFISILLVFVLALSAFSCKKSCKNKDEKYTETVFISNKETDFKLVVPADKSSKEELAASEFNELIKLSIDNQLKVVDDTSINYSSGDHYIFLGLVKQLEDFGIEPKVDEIGDQGYIIKNVDKDNSVVITGATKNGYGTVYGVYEFLYQQFNYDTYAYNETYIDEVENANLINIDIVDKPDIPNNWGHGGAYGTDSNFLHRSRAINQGELFTYSMSPYHTSFVFLNPDKYAEAHPMWYTKNIDNVCWTAHGDAIEYEAMVNQLFENFRVYVDANEDLVHIGFSMQDVITWCTCDACKKVIADYGANSASCIMLLNDLSDKFEEYFAQTGRQDRKLDFMFLAYKETVSPPAKEVDGEWVPAAQEVVCKENVYPFLCLFYTNRAAPFTDAKNTATYKQMEGWRVCCSQMAVWYYSANYSNYLIPIDPFNCLQENYQYMATFNPLFLHDESCGYGSSFALFKDWLSCKVAWDVNANIEELTDAYFTHYFQDAKEPMLRYYRSFRVAMARVLDEYNENHYDHTAIKKEYYPYGLLMSWMDCINEAYESIEYLKVKNPDLYQKLYVRILTESITPRYVIINYFSEYYSSAEVARMKSSFKSDCGLCKITEALEGLSIDNLWNA